MVSFTDALALISTNVQARSQRGAVVGERVSLDEALGRICFSDVVSGESFPARPTSAMDGFAVHSSLTLSANASAPAALPILGIIAAGDEPPRVGVGVWEIMTGAAMPSACDACVRLEDVVVRDGLCVIAAPVAIGTNVRRAGEDFSQGDVLVRAGEVVRSEDILVLATLGVQTVDVYRRPRVAIIATGKELAGSGEVLRHSAQIRNSTTPFLLAALRERGASAHFLGAVGDEPSEFHRLFDRADNGDYDLILTTGALSVGRHDFIAAALTDRQVELFFRKVAIRPGKPLLFGRSKRGTFVIGLPGNPVASLVGLRFFVDAFLRAWVGSSFTATLRLPLLDAKLGKPVGVTSFFRASLCPLTGHVRTHAAQKASLLHPLLQTDVWVSLPDEISCARRGDAVSVWPYLSTVSRRAGSV